MALQDSSHQASTSSDEKVEHADSATEKTAQLSSSTGLTTVQARHAQEREGFNDVKSRKEPKWKKIPWRYLDWVSLVIVRRWH